MAKLLYLISEDWFFCSHFMERAKAAQAQGFEIVVLTREREHAQRIRDAGFELVPLTLDRSSTGLWKELVALRQIRNAYRQHQPDLVHQIAMKPIIYGSLVARFVGPRAVLNAPVGMGYLFTSASAKARLLRPLIRVLLKWLLNPRGSKVVFENEEDLADCVRSRMVRAADAVLIPGAGVDTALFHPPADLQIGQPPIVIMAARLLRDKGVAEFVEAAALLRQRGVRARCWLVGAPDPGNPSSFDTAQLDVWKAQGNVELLGQRDDMAELLRQCDIACLPSYREGLPKFLLEAMATGLPVVATDVVGCRQAVENERSGLLVPARNAVALADALQRLIGDAPTRSRMAAAGRTRAQQAFSSERIERLTLAQYAELATIPSHLQPSHLQPSQEPLWPGGSDAS